MYNTRAPLILGKDDVFVVSTLDGSDTLYSRAFDCTYHSVKGAVSESRHVFIRNGLEKLAHLPSVRVLEIGFGTGLNAFLAFLFSQSHQKEIFYTGIESFSLDIRIVNELNYPQYLLAESSKEIFLKMHREDQFSTASFHFQKFQTLDQTPSDLMADCIFFDAFSPAEQGEMWDQNIFNTLYNLTSQNGYLVTYCAKGEIRRRIENAGYLVNRLPGAPGKREMIQAVKK